MFSVAPALLHTFDSDADEPLSMYQNPMRIVSIVDQIQIYLPAQYSTFGRRNKAKMYLWRLIV